MNKDKWKVYKFFLWLSIIWYNLGLLIVLFAFIWKIEKNVNIIFILFTVGLALNILNSIIFLRLTGKCYESGFLGQYLTMVQASMPIYGFFYYRMHIAEINLETDLQKKDKI